MLTDDEKRLTIRRAVFATIEAELDRAYAKHGSPQWGRHGLPPIRQRDL